MRVCAVADVKCMNITYVMYTDNGPLDGRLVVQFSLKKTSLIHLRQ